MRRAVPLCLAGLALAALPASPGSAATGFLQASSPRDGVVLELSERALTARHPDGRAQRLRLRPAERPLSLVELETGWIAAGIRVSEEGADLLLIEQGAAGPRRLRLPAASAGGPLLRTRPVLFAAGGRLEGMAWLEGVPGEPLSVLAARREEGGWSPPEVVSRPGRGSQTGLAGGVLADGRRLLVWSRFDGEDDELVWSLGDDDGWSPLRPVHDENSTPDIAPALFVDGDVVLLAWNRLLGDEYDLLTARWEGARWGEARRVAGPGALYPSFTGLDGDPYALVRLARSGRWGVLDLDRSGAVVRRLDVPDDGGRPALLGGSGNRAELLFAGDEKPRHALWRTAEP